MKSVDNSQELSDIPSSLTGENREHLVATWREKYTRLRIASGRMSLLESNNKIADEVESISHVSKSADNPDPVEVINIQKKTEENVKEFLRLIQSTYKTNYGKGN